MAGRILLDADGTGGAFFVHPKGLTPLALSDLRLCLEATTHGEFLPDGGVSMRAIHLLRHLADLRVVCKRHAIAIEYSAGARQLVEKFVEESRACRRAGLNGSLYSEDELKQRLTAVGFRRELTVEQTRDTLSLTALPHGANFSVPGAGKTTTLLAVFALARAQKRDLRLLIVAPKNAFISWDEELEACLGPDAKALRLDGGSDGVQHKLLGNPDIAIINYELARNSREPLRAFVQRCPVQVVLDEAHRIKGGPEKATASAMLDLAPFAERRDIMTGTPMPQGIADIEPQFEFLWPGQDLLRPALRLSAADEAIAVATDAVRPLYVRTTKDELDLPPVRTQTVSVPLLPSQQAIYELIRSEAARQSRGLDRASTRYFRRMRSQVVRLLQAASNPALIAGVDLESADDDPLNSIEPEEFRLLLMEFREEGSAKLAACEALARRIAEEDGQKTVIWSAFIGNIRLLSDRLADLGALELYGATPTGDAEDSLTREGRLRLFHHDDHCRVMIANPAACGEGISLHRVCRNAIYLDRTFNAAHYLQSVDRIHRLGLPRDAEVKVILLQAEGTIDEVVEERLSVKIARMGMLLNDANLTALAYDPEDVGDYSLDGLDASDLEALYAHLFHGETAGR